MIDVSCWTTGTEEDVKAELFGITAETIESDDDDGAGDAPIWPCCFTDMMAST
ncbi:MAG: hypothetical protein Q9P01_22360 [Anaerolineae bacterium]|nr:hypothetical protein [Anaerolineae bacterium]